MKIPLLAVFCASISLAWWSPPIDLGIEGVNDINPQACRAQVLDDLWIVVVWESNLNGYDDIFSRFSNGSTWSDTFRISTDVFMDESPSVAYDPARDCFWCVWHYYGSGNDGIYVSQGSEINGWSPPHQLTSDTLMEDLPSICVISDTVWVVWQRGLLIGDSVSFMNIYASYYDGTSWSTPYPLTNDSEVVNCRPKINIRYDHPLVVWQKIESASNIYYTEYLNGSWQIPQPITDDTYFNANPEIASLGQYSGIWIVWETNRDGNYEIYTTAFDTLNVQYRRTFNDSADITPSPLPFMAIGRQEGPPITAFSTNRNGNYDVYTLFSLGYPGDTLIQVDTSRADDVWPVMTGSLMYLWVFWQTNRDGDWDIYGSYIFIDRVQEDGKKTLWRSIPYISPNPTRASFTIHSPTPLQDIEIYDVCGRLLKAESWSEVQRKREVSLVNVDPGVYFVKVITEGNEFIRKVVVAR
ncbi:hypothetical protein AMJ52_08015 [candidate division TA06 bacterium DG_78]|uniref:Secretion system C-terminal sorting domain-containing protein n=1 Tax=candidate division TA06 bacterium DG_78 TaxID=1703772 RepID=A0A0S7YB20_UNCT6|nr:MAG: hypothetical protein AMJ52_08015 [candidate division TA06 bacterium DG_78]